MQRKKAVLLVNLGTPDSPKTKDVRSYLFQFLNDKRVIDIPFLIPLMAKHMFSSIFVLLCFLFVINGANLIDGFNCLLTINLIIINSILLYLNLSNGNLKIAYLKLYFFAKDRIKFSSIIFTIR